MNFLEDKQFSCDPVGCTAKQLGDACSSEDKRRHDMVLNVTYKGSLFADQTPTPTRFIRNCEEVGLFQDLQNVNPFEETFRKAAEAAQKGEPSIQPSNTASDDTLHTPDVFPLITDPPVSVSPENNDDANASTSPAAVPPKTRKYTKRRRRVDAQTDCPQYFVHGSNVTFKLPIPMLPPAIKVFTPKYFRVLSKKASEKPRVLQEVTSSKTDKKESNRIAAMRSREKKKHYIHYLEKLNQELLAKTASMKKRIASLTEENSRLKGEKVDGENVNKEIKNDFNRNPTIILTEEKESVGNEEAELDQLQQLLHQPQSKMVYAEHSYLNTSANYSEEQRLFYSTLPSATISTNTCFLRKPFKKRSIDSLI